MLGAMQRTKWFILLSLFYFFANVRSLAPAVEEEPEPEECPGKYATTTGEGAGGFTVSTNVYEQCVQDNGHKDTKEQYWMRYECEYDEEEAPGTLVKYVYAANDMCVGNQTGIVDIDPEDEVIADWCCQWVAHIGFEPVLLPPPDEDSEPSTSTPTTPSPVKMHALTTKSVVTTMSSTRNIDNSIVALALASTLEDLDADEGVEDGNNDQSSAYQNHSHAIRAAALPGMPVHALSLVIVLVIFCCVVYSFATSKSIQLYVKVSVLFTMLANATAIASIIAMSSIMIAADQWDTATYETASMPYFAAVIGYICGKMGLETFFILRAYNAFKGSAFAVSKRTVYVAFLCMLTIAVLWAWAVVFFPVSNEHMQKDYFYVILSVLDTLFVAGLLFIFISKLNGLVLTKQSACAADLASPSACARHAVVASESATATPQSTSLASTAPGEKKMVEKVRRNLNVHQTELIFVITRCIILNSIAFCTTILFGFLSFFYLRNAAPLYVLYSSWSLDMLINSVCLYLNLACSAGLYNRCCICCHQKCQRLMEHYAAQRIVRDQTTSKGETEQSNV